MFDTLNGEKREDVRRANIRAKLGMASRAEIAAWAVRRGLTSD